MSDDEEKDAHNTDAFDVSDSTGIIIQHSTIVNGDDCIAVNGTNSIKRALLSEFIIIVFLIYFTFFFNTII